MPVSQKAQVKFGSYLAVIFLLILTLAIAQETDLNLPILPAEPEMPKEIIAISIVSPILQETVSGTGIVIVSVSSAEKITRAWFEIEGKNLGSLSVQNNFSSEFDSRQFENNKYIFSVNACIEENCEKKEIEIEIKNEVPEVEPPVTEPELPQEPDLNQPTDQNTPPLQEEQPPTQEPPELPVEPPITQPDQNQPELPQEPTEELSPEPQQELFSITGSNYYSALTVFDANNQIVSSGTGEVLVPAGNYNLQIDFFDLMLSSVLLQNAVVDSNSTIIDLNNFSDFNSLPQIDANLFWVKFSAIKTNVEYKDGTVVFLPQEQFDKMLWCKSWDFFSSNCSRGFEEINNAEQSKVGLTISTQTNAFGYAKIFIDQNFVPDFNSDVFDDNSVKIKIKKLGKRFLKLSREKLNFAANDSPQIDLELTDENGTKIDEEFNSFLILPDGTQTEISTKNVEKKGEGQYRIKVKMPNSFKAGTYSVKTLVQTDTGTAEETQSFEWGLIAVNTAKSIYRPGETAEFQVVVLDRESFGVSNATVTLNIISPTGQTQILSTLNGTIGETTSSGVYFGKFVVFEEGEYKVQAQATAPPIDTAIETNFLVAKDFDFDIVRHTATKIDPAVQPIKVEIDFTSLKSDQKNATIREVVPKEFMVSSKKLKSVQLGEELLEEEIEDPNLIITETDSEKILEWSNVELMQNKETTLTYEYSVPDKKPWLYLIGPSEIADSNTTLFTEFKSWMIAVDANPTSIFYFRADSNVGAAPEPMPNDANCSSGCDYGSPIYVGSDTQDINRMTDSIGAGIATKTITTGTTYGIKKMVSFVSPPFVPQTLTTSGTWIGSVFCILSGTNNTSRPAFAIYRWKNSDSNGERITPFFINAIAAQVCPATLGIRYVSKTGTPSSVTFDRGDKLVIEVDVNVQPPAIGTFIDRNITFGWNGAVNLGDSNLTFPSGVTARLAGDLNTGIVAPANNSSFGALASFDVNVLGSCRNYDCGDTNVILQYCFNPAAGCTFYDMNTVSSSKMYISSGSATRNDDNLNANDTNYFVFTIKSTDTNTYTIRAKIDSNWSADANYSNLSNADVNVTIVTQNYAFAVSLPSSGCTDGKGRLTGQGNGACQRGYFETTDLSGTATETNISPEGQNSTTPFIVYDNQSSTGNDLNITLVLSGTAQIHAIYPLKVSKSFTGWESTCSGNIETGCLQVPRSISTNLSKVVYTSGTQDFNLFAFGDFSDAPVASQDRDVTHESVDP